jgi:ABC-2 type transport system permease protein
VSAGALPLTTASHSRMAETRRFVSLVYTIAVTEWKLRYFGSALGYLWTLMRPLLMFGVLYLVFTEIAKVGDKIPHYPALLLADIVLYQYFAEATSNSVACLVERESLLRKVRFPRMVIPLAVCTTSLFNVTGAFIAVIAFVLFNGAQPTWAWLELPVLVGLLTAFAVGISLLLSVWYVRFRDVRPIWEVVVQMLFYGSPIFYTIDLYGRFQQTMARTPFAAILTQLRHVLVDPAAQGAGAAAGGRIYLLIPLGTIFAILALGVYVFHRASPTLAERL